MYNWTSVWFRTRVCVLLPVVAYDWAILQLEIQLALEIIHERLKYTVQSEVGSKTATVELRLHSESKRKVQHPDLCILDWNPSSGHASWKSVQQFLCNPAIDRQMDAGENTLYLQLISASCSEVFWAEWQNESSPPNGVSELKCYWPWKALYCCSTVSGSNRSVAEVHCTWRSLKKANTSGLFVFLCGSPFLRHLLYLLDRLRSSSPCVMRFHWRSQVHDQGVN